MAVMGLLVQVGIEFPVLFCTWGTSDMMQGFVPSFVGGVAPLVLIMGNHVLHK